MSFRFREIGVQIPGLPFGGFEPRQKKNVNSLLEPFVLGKSGKQHFTDLCEE